MKTAQHIVGLYVVVFCCWFYGWRACFGHDTTGQRAWECRVFWWDFCSCRCSCVCIVYSFFLLRDDEWWWRDDRESAARAKASSCSFRLEFTHALWLDCINHQTHARESKIVNETNPKQTETEQIRKFACKFAPTTRTFLRAGGGRGGENKLCKRNPCLL